LPRDILGDYAELKGGNVMTLTPMTEARLNEAQLPMNPDEMKLDEEQLEILLTFEQAAEI